jgi:hypothetical protein
MGANLGAHKVGILTTSPATTLDVRGDLSASTGQFGTASVSTYTLTVNGSMKIAGATTNEICFADNTCQNSAGVGSASQLISAGDATIKAGTQISTFTSTGNLQVPHGIVASTFTGTFIGTASTATYANTAGALATAGTTASSGYLCRGVDASGNCLPALVDTSATSSSTNTITSGAMYTALAGKADISGQVFTGDITAPNINISSLAIGGALNQLNLSNTNAIDIVSDSDKDGSGQINFLVGASTITTVSNTGLSSTNLTATYGVSVATITTTSTATLAAAAITGAVKITSGASGGATALSDASGNMSWSVNRSTYATIAAPINGTSAIGVCVAGSTVTYTTSGAPIIVVFSGSMSTSGAAGQNVQASAVIDGSRPSTVPIIYTTPNDSNQDTAVGFVSAPIALAAGSHWACLSAGTSSGTWKVEGSSIFGFHELH